MSIRLEHLRVHAIEVEQFVDQDYAIYQPGTLLTITDIDSYKRITIFFYQLGHGVQGFIQTKEKQPFDPFYLKVPINESIYFHTDHCDCTLRYYPFDYCSNKGEFPIELVIGNPKNEHTYSIEVSFDGRVKLY